MIQIESKRKKRENILKKYPDAIIADVTSHAEDDLIKLSPFYPHGGIPVPFSEGVTATCVEAVWQGLKVFESADVDMKMFKNESMKNIKRTVRKFGKPLGHRKGVNGTELLGYIEARKQIISLLTSGFLNIRFKVLSKDYERLARLRPSYFWIIIQIVMWMTRRSLFRMPF